MYIKFRLKATDNPQIIQSDNFFFNKEKQSMIILRREGNIIIFNHNILSVTKQRPIRRKNKWAKDHVHLFN